MPVTPTHPGVYVQEVPSGVRTITGVATSVAMFIGTARKGPMAKPVRLSTYTDFARAFSDDAAGGALANYVKLFFLNGGADCYVMRIANAPSRAFVTLRNEAGAQVLRLEARDPGRAGEDIRAVVTYNGQQPEATFNLDLFRWVLDANGNRGKRDLESWKGLNMNPASPLYAVDFVTQNSKLVSAAPGGAIPAAVPGFSLSGRAVPNGAGFQAAWSPLFGTVPAAVPATNTNKLLIRVAGSPFVDVDFSAVAVTNVVANVQAAMQAAITARFTLLGMPGVAVNVTFPAGPPNFRRIRFESAAGDVFIQPAPQADLAVPLMLGTAQGGLEVSGRAAQRPAPNGITFQASDPAALNTLAGTAQGALAQLTLDALLPTPVPTYAAQVVSLTAPVPPPSVVTTAPADLVLTDAAATSANGNSDGLREKLAIVAQRINNALPTPPATLRWAAQVWGSRLAILPTGNDDNFLPAFFAAAPAALTARFTQNVAAYTLGTGGNNLGLQVSAGAVASDGNPPTAADYDAAYEVIDREVDLFNLMVLPPDAAVDIDQVYGKASVFCQSRRAVLLMDPPAAWADTQTASTGVNALRIGLVKDYSALFFPRLVIDDRGKLVPIGPAGAVAGLCARIDATRGVWKTPAGTEADLRGVRGLDLRMSDRENGWINPRGVNAIRVFPNGIVSWGGRTMDGDDDFASEYKYLAIRRLANYIEESLYRGVKWVVFEPNDEPLWSQVRLNVGAFMHNLFRQGAFAGRQPKDAYFVKCDRETTTQNDQNLGIVNIWVGFAPLKPAEFVVLYLQQMAGQIEV
jgi:phage tail sheath protein FI